MEELIVYTIILLAVVYVAIQLYNKIKSNKHSCNDKCNDCPLVDKCSKKCDSMNC